MLKPNRVLMEGAPGASGGGAPAAAPAAAPAPAAPAAAAPAVTAAGGSVLAKAGEGAPAAAPAVPGKPEEWTLPDKFKVVKEDGTLDIEASARKMGESHASLEKRMGAGEAPPKTAEEYKVTVPDEWKDAFPEDSATMTELRKDAHAQGLNQKQFDFFIGKYIQHATDLVAGGAAYSFEKADAELRGEWKTDAEYKTHTGHAFKAWKAFADPKDAGKMDEVGNSPAVVRLLARIGKEMGEGGSIPNAAETVGADEITSLMGSPAASDPKHADHKATRAKIDAYYAKKYGTAAVT